MTPPERDDPSSEGGLRPGFALYFLLPLVLGLMGWCSSIAFSRASDDLSEELAVEACDPVGIHPRCP